MRKKRILLFASGSGSNAENLVHYFATSSVAEVVGIVTDNPKAFIIERAERLGVPLRIIPRSVLSSTDGVEQVMQFAPDCIVLVGYLGLISAQLIEAVRGMIINLHPALLPKYGGKGMYGMHVHRQVLAAGERESGITIHWVNEQFDAGDIIMQVRIPIIEGTDENQLAHNIHKLEHRFLPFTVETILQSGQLYQPPYVGMTQ